MDNHSLTPIPSSKYDDFLLSVIGENSNGTELSVLSTLTQVNVDPWNEAARLSRLPRAAAEKALVSILDRTSGGVRTGPEEKTAIAIRLVRLLPRPGGGGSSAARAIGRRVHLTGFWLAWVTFAIAISILLHHHRTMTSSAGVASRQSDATVLLRNGREEDTSKSVSNRSFE